jgi:K+-sensing histidine kinase KdpD
VAGDAQRLRQVLLNLAGNAVKFTETGGVGVRVTRDGAGRLRFSVVDTGPGVPLAQRETIFAEFEQGDNVGALGGAGLGLAISSRLVAAMGGTLRLDSPPGGGAVFSFAITLPDAGPRPAGRRRSASSSAGARSSSRNRRSRRRGSASAWPTPARKCAPSPGRRPRSTRSPI